LRAVLAVDSVDCQNPAEAGIPTNQPAAFGRRRGFRRFPFPMKMRPLHDRILVKRVEEEAKTKGGIIIPDTAKEKPQEAKVVAVGSGRVTDDGKVVALEVKKGDRVLFGKYSGSEVTIEGEEHLIIREEDILAIIE
jgi:chaperonin GroES